MTFEQFQKTRQWCEDLVDRIPDMSMEKAKGYVYCGSLWIEDTTSWPPGGPGHDKGRRFEASLLKLVLRGEVVVSIEEGEIAFHKPDPQTKEKLLRAFRGAKSE